MRRKPNLEDAETLSGLDAGLLSPGLDAGFLQVLNTQSRQRCDLFIEQFASPRQALALALVQHDSKLRSRPRPSSSRASSLVVPSLS